MNRFSCRAGHRSSVTWNYSILRELLLGKHQRAIMLIRNAFLLLICRSVSPSPEQRIKTWFDTFLSFESYRHAVQFQQTSRGRKLVSVRDFDEWNFNFTGSLHETGVPDGDGVVHIQQVRSDCELQNVLSISQKDKFLRLYL